MSFSDWLKNQKSNIEHEITKFKNRDFLQAVVSGCAMVAYADGEITPEEKAKMSRYLQVSNELKHFDIKDAIDIFNDLVTKFDFDLQVGRAEALKVIGKLKKKPEEGRMLIRVCCAIGAADGNFDDDEKEVVRLICRELNLNPAEFSL
jgi:tellurite resistance protein TerB